MKPDTHLTALRDPRRRKAGKQELKSQNAERKDLLARALSVKKALDERGKYLVQTYGNKPNVKTIPYKKPATVDNYEETESQNTPRKVVLAARTSGRGDPKNRPGRRNALGITKYNEGDILKMFYDHLAKEKETTKSNEGLKTKLMVMKAKIEA